MAPARTDPPDTNDPDALRLRVVAETEGQLDAHVTEREALRAVVVRLRAANGDKPTRPKSLAITHIEEAIHWLDHTEGD